MILAQLPVNQFRSIAWYNAAIGVVVIFIFILTFKEEMKWNRRPIKCTSWNSNKDKDPLTSDSDTASKGLSLIVSFPVYCIVGLLHFVIQMQEIYLYIL